MKKADTGFIYVATVKKGFYNAAVKSAESLKDFYPDAHITFFTLEEWVTEDDYDLFDNIVTDIPNEVRTKLWALDKTPYEVTCYLDCDTSIEHEDIEYVFDVLPEDKDIVFTKNRPYNSKITKLNEEEEMTCHCGFFVYRKNERTLNLMSSWYEQYVKQVRSDYPNTEGYPKEALGWDTFSMYYILTHTCPDVKWGYIEEPDARWNFVWGYRDDELQGTERVVYHYTIPRHML